MREKKNKDRIRQLFFGIGMFGLMILTGSSLTGCKREIKQEKTEEILGTIVSGEVYTKEGQEPLIAAFERAKELEHILSANDENSELSKVNQNAYQRETKVSKELFYVVQKGIYYGKKTDGALDITIGKMIDLWGIGTDEAGVPEQNELAPYIKQKGYEKIKLNKKKRTIRFLDETVQLNLGAIAKGYIADEMKGVLVEEYGIKHGMLSLGGNIVVIGDKTDGSPWNVGIVDPLHTQSVKASFSISDQTLVTSGNYERYFEQDGVRYHHILDPETGYPAKNGLISTSILTNSSIDADALSTATYILGEEKGLKILEEMKNCEGVFVREDGSLVTTSKVARYGYQEY